tara:strand:- start:1368 stop:1628 length:261 start_codon:yes stop_codon:yes gene_type:complete
MRGLMTLLEAAKKINKLLEEAAKNKTSFVDTLEEVRRVEVHGVRFSNMMLLEIIKDFIENYDVGKAQEDIQDTFDDAEHTWHNKVH